MDMSTADGTITSWNWAFGDGDTSTLQNPSHVYSTPGAYPVTLTITTSWGCIDTTTTKLGIYGLPVADAGNDTTICIGDTAQLAATGGVSYTWSPAATLNDATIPNPLAFPSTKTKYFVTV